MPTEPTEGSQPLLRAQGVSKRFPGVQALDRVDFDIRPGELHALLGENGAGKSTLMGILAGVFPPDSGSLLLDGRPACLRSPRDAQEKGIAIIYQELSLIPQLSVAENIFLGREPLTILRTIDYRRMHRQAAGILERLECGIDTATPVGRLRVGQQQVIEIARALALSSRIVIMDEPTSALSDQEARVLFSLIARLKEQGAGIAYITHKLEELFEIADRVTVLRDGRRIGTRSLRDLDRNAMIGMMVGRDLSDLFRRSASIREGAALRVRSLGLRRSRSSKRYLFRNVDLEVRRGEVVGVFGLMGSGRTELLEAIFGLHPGRVEGRLELEGRPVRIRSPRDAIASGIVMAPEDRKELGLILKMDVVSNASLASLSQCSILGWILGRRERRQVGGYVRRLGIRTPSLRQPIRDLSGGNQQKVVLAKWLSTRPRVLLLDEPTRGIDINAKREIYGLVDELARSGLAVLMVSSELPEILALSDRIVVFCEGARTAELDGAGATEEAIMEAALPRGRPGLTGS